MRTEVWQSPEEPMFIAGMLVALSVVVELAIGTVSVFVVVSARVGAVVMAIERKMVRYVR